ncbi:hypothetical protein BLX87_22235 [Bacillus sp. VT-16-64]|nr:hypothetical protein BLX87_22235 [Bacillus sp. VT-16-64]
MAENTHADPVNGVELVGRDQRIGLVMGHEPAARQGDQPVAEARGHVDIVQDDQDRAIMLMRQHADEAHHFDLVVDIERRDRRPATTVAW